MLTSKENLWTMTRFHSKVSSGACLPTRSLRFSTWRNANYKLHIVSLQNPKFGLENVTETLQKIGDRMIKNENFARLKDFLRYDGDRKVQPQNILLGKALWDGPNIPSEKKFEHKDLVGEHDENEVELDFPFVSNGTPKAFASKGQLSPPAISSIEQFSRLKGVESNEMIQDFYSQSTISLQNDARHLIEYCCFTYIAKFTGDIHPHLKDATFRKLIFITMLAWQQPFANSQNEHEKMVREHAFCRIAPAIPGVADRATAHKLYEALTNGEVGLSFSVWNTYISELLRVFEERKHHKIHESSILSLEDDEIVLCVGSSKRQPVQMWNSANIAWPGRLTLTDRSLYFEPNGLFQHQKPMKLNLTGGDGTVEKIKVGPLGAPVLDSAIMVKTDSKSDPWVLEFVDFSGGGRRGLWFAFVNELLLAYRFIAQYGPPAHDPFIYDIQDNQSGTRKVIMSAINGMARVQALQSTLGRLTVYPMKLLQFSHLDDHPSGDIVKQTLAVNIWGIQLVGNQKNPKKLTTDDSIIDAIGSGLHAVDVDRSVYLHRWMRSPTWQSPTSSSFWKQKVGGKALILRKDLVIGDLTHTERAVKAFKEQTQMIERTKATISGALVKGIPSNIDLFKELMLPFTLLSIHLRKLQKWERPRDTLFFLASFLLLLYKGWFKYAMPVIFLTTSVLAFTLHNLKYQGRLADNFGQVVIREQPPSNSLQKMLALKEALEEVEVQIQKVNIAILKLRSLALAGHPQAKNIVALSLLAGGLILVFVPFRYVCTFVLLDQFTCELDFRRATVLKLARQLHDWWEAIPAAPVVVLPYEEQEGGDRDIKPDDSASPKGEVIAEAIKEWVAESF